MDEYTKFKEAITSNDTEAFNKWKTQNPALYEYEEFKTAIYSDDTETITKTLTKNSALINMQGHDGLTPIFTAMDELIEMKTFELLLQHGADVNHIDKAGRNLLQFVFDVFLEKPSSIDKIVIVIQRIDDDLCRSVNHRNMTLLHFIDLIHITRHSNTSKKRRKDTCHACKRFVNALVEKQVDVNLIDHAMKTPLEVAASCGCLSAIKILLSHGAEIRFRTETETILDFACMISEFGNFTKCVDYFLEMGCDINATCKETGNALHTVVQADFPRLKKIKYLVEKGINVKSVDHAGDTVLHNIIQSAKEEPINSKQEWKKIEKDTSDCLRYLVAVGADVNSQNKYGYTPVHVAADHSEYNFMSVLLELGGDINVKAFTGETPLHVAVFEEVPLEAIFEKLPFKDIDLEITDHYGSTPAHWAIAHRNVRLFELVPEPGVPVAMVDSKGRDLFDLWISLHNDVIQTVEIITQESETNIDLDHNYYSSYSKRQTTSKDYDKPTDNGGLNLASEPRRRNEDKSIDEHVQLDFESQNTSKDKEDPRRNDYLKLYGRNQPTYDLTLRNNIQAHHESNCGENLSILGECPILRWLFEEGETLMNVDIPLNKWLTHLAQHKQNVCGYISLILESPDMGLYFNLVENRHVEEAVHSTMKEMADRLAISCPILKSVVELRGSRCEGAKVGYPDEFDYIFYLTEFETAVVPEESNEHGYVRLRIIRKEDRMKFKDFINEDGFVDALKVIPKIFMCYNSVIEDEGFMKRANLYPLKMLDPLKYSIDNFEFLWTGPTYKRMKVSVDIVPAIRLSTWMPECVNTSPKLLREFHIKPQVSAVFKTQNSTLKKA